MAEQVGKLVLAMGSQPILYVLPRSVFDVFPVKDLVTQRRAYFARGLRDVVGKRPPSPEVSRP